MSEKAALHMVFSLWKYVCYSAIQHHQLHIKACGHFYIHAPKEESLVQCGLIKFIVKVFKHLKYVCVYVGKKMYKNLGSFLNE